MFHLKNSAEDNTGERDESCLLNVDPGISKILAMALAASISADTIP